MSKSATSPRPSRAPNGSTAHTMIMLTPEERQELNAIATQECRSVSATGRLMLIRGMQSYQKSLAS